MTIELASLGLLVALAIGLPVGVTAALHRGQVGDYLANIFVLLGLSVPSFWLAVLLILAFSLRLGWLPPTGYLAPQESVSENIRHLLLPALALGLALAAAIARIVRSSLLEVLGRSFPVPLHAVRGGAEEHCGIPALAEHIIPRPPVDVDGRPLDDRSLRDPAPST